MLFILSVDHEGRVILDTVAHGKKLRAIKAKPKVSGGYIVRSAWQRSRDRVVDSRYFREYGHGYFVSKARRDERGREH